MLTPALVRDAVARALAEDAPWGDATVDAVIPSGTRATALIDAREPGVLAGSRVADEAFAQTSERTVRVRWLIEEGGAFEEGQRIAEVSGPASSVLTAERVALNFLQRLSGIATATSRYVHAVAGTHVRIADTRKTTPGLRALEKHAVRMGGGENHRFSLSDAVMVKDNHLALLTQNGLDVTEALRGIRARIGHTVHLEVEVDRLDQLPAVLAAEPDSILLDNFSLPDLAEGVRRIGGRAIVEASGGVTFDTVRGIAETGVDIISVGALTHSVRALDLGLDVELT